MHEVALALCFLAPAVCEGTLTTIQLENGPVPQDQVKMDTGQTVFTTESKFEVQHSRSEQWVANPSRILVMLLEGFNPLAGFISINPGARNHLGMRASGMSMNSEVMPEAPAISGRAPIDFFTLEMCPYAQRVWIALEELGIPYSAKTVNVRGGDKDWYMAEINPRGKVPALRDPEADNLVIYESLICLEYLAELVGGTPLLPSSPITRARMRLWNEHLDNQLAPAHFTLLMNKNESATAEKRVALNAALDHYEANLAGPYLLGDFSLADVAAAPFFERLVFSLRHFHNFDALEGYPRTAAWLEKVMEQPSVVKTLRPEDKLVELYERFLSIDYSFGGLNKN